MKEKIEQVLRNIELRPEDLVNCELTKSFYGRKDISEEKKELCKKINKIF